MSYIGTTDYYLNVANSDVANRSLVHKFGLNEDIDTASNFEAIWQAGNGYTGFDPSSAEVVDIVSSSSADNASGTGARTIQVYGLDGDFVEQNETVTLHASDGTIAVSTSNSYIRLNRMIVRTAGTGGSNAGTITADTTTTGDVLATIATGYNQTMIAAYTIPAGKTGYLLSWFASQANKVSAYNNVRMLHRPQNQVFQVKEEFALNTNGSSYVQRVYQSPNGPISAKTDMYIAADTSANDVAVSAGFDLVLV
jgi:hypothetical protein